MRMNTNKIKFPHKKLQEYLALAELILLCDAGHILKSTKNKYILLRWYHLI